MHPLIYTFLDPIFYLHHANVDRIWVIWQDYHQHDLVGETRYGWQQYSGSLDSPMQFIGSDRILNFNVPGTNQPPTPRQVLTNFDSLVDVTYINDNLGLQLTRADSSYGISNAYGIRGNNRNWITMANDRVNERCTGDNNNYIHRGSNTNAVVPNDQRTPTNNNNNAGGVRNGQGTTVNNNNNNGSTNGRNDQLPWANNLPTRSSSSSTINNNLGIVQQPICNDDGEQCQLTRACCSGTCFRNWCCRRETSACSSSNDCCSGFCGWGTCRERTRELLVDRDYQQLLAGDVTEENEDRDAAADQQQQQRRHAPEFSNPILNQRWVELTRRFPHEEPTRVLEQLAREDCEQRMTAHPELRSATSAWMIINNMTDTPHVFDCHYDNTRELVKDEQLKTTSDGFSPRFCQAGPSSCFGFLASCLLLSLYFY